MKLEEIRKAVADYMSSEGCSCCQNVEAHQRHAAALAKLLHVPKYEDGSGYDFSRFRTEHSNGDGKHGS
jgi:hypothetical protein